MTEQPFNRMVYVLGYPIALAGMLAFYASEAVDIAIRATRKMLAIDSIAGRK